MSAPWAGAIDVHHHVVPEFYGDLLGELGAATSLPGVKAPTWTPRVSLDMMDRQGIAAAVVNVWPGVPAVAPDVGLAVARQVNRFLAELVDSHPSRFGAFAVLPLPHVDASLEALEHAIDELGLDGVGMVTNYGGTYVGDEVLAPVLGEIARRGLPVFLHPTQSPAQGQPLFDLPGSLCEFPFETIRAVTQLLYSGTLQKHPDLKLILSHGGGGLPYLAERLTYGPIIDPALRARIVDDPMGRIQALYYDIAMAGNRFALPSLRALVPTDRILVGTDFPFMPEGSGEENARSFLAHGELEAEALAEVTSGTAGRLFPRLAARQLA